MSAIANSQALSLPGPSATPALSPASLLSTPVVVDQGAQLRSMMRERARALVIAVTSGKGGVGKSNIAVNLAVKFAGAGKDVVLLDADLGLANADVLCNLDLPCNLSHVIARKKDLREVMYKAPGGFRLIGGAAGPAPMAGPAQGDRQHPLTPPGGPAQSGDNLLIAT